MTAAEVNSFLRYTVQAPTSFVFQVAAQSTEHQRIINESLVVSRVAREARTEVDRDGNRLLRLFAEPGTLTIEYAATVELADAPAAHEPPEERAHFDLPTSVLPYLAPSHYCASDRLEQLAFAEFGHLEPGVPRVTAICDWLAERMAYAPGSTDRLTTADEALAQRAGVCRDYAHLAIAFCRALCVPARYVSGYAVGLVPQDFHGVFEVYLGSDWYLFDPSRLMPGPEFVRIAMGRDAADAPFATIVGDAVLEEIAVDARRHSRTWEPHVTSAAPAA